MATVQSLRIGVSRNSRMKDKDTWSHISLVSWVDEMRVRITHSAIGTDRNINVRLLNQHFGGCFLVSELRESWKKEKWVVLLSLNLYYRKLISLSSSFPSMPLGGVLDTSILQAKGFWLAEGDMIQASSAYPLQYDKGPMPLESVLYWVNVPYCLLFFIDWAPRHVSISTCFQKKTVTMTRENNNIWHVTYKGSCLPFVRCDRLF